MAVVPFKVSGPAADHQAEERLLLVGPYSLKLAQRPSDSGASRHLADGAARVEWPQDDADDAAAAAAARRPDLSNVGLVVWSSGFVLADLLIRRPPLGPWPGVSVLELGSGTGVCGMFLAAAGARVVLSDLPHITPLTRANVAANCAAGGAAGAPLVVEYAWGEPAHALRASVAAAAAGAAAASGGGALHWQEWAGAAAGAPDAAAGGGGGDPDHEAGGDQIAFDLIVGADVLYDREGHAPLLASLQQLASPHTQVYLSYRRRGLGEEGFFAAAAAAGWAASGAPAELLHPEFQGGDYFVVALCKL